MSINNKKIAIDIGTSHTRIFLPRKGLVLNQPTVLARDESVNKIVALGDDAVEMVGRSPENFSIVKPLKHGVIADFDSTNYLLKNFIQQSLGRFRLSKPEAMMTVSATATSTERKALVDAGLAAGLQQVHLIPSAVAAALGSGLPTNKPRGNLVIDIGSGTTEVAILSLGGIVVERSRRQGGSFIDDAITYFLRREHSLTIGSQELFKIKSSFLDLDQDRNKTMTVHGQNTIQGQPKSVTIKLGQLRAYVETALDKTVLLLRKVLEKTPPDLISDIIKHGALISGGGAQIKGLDAYLSKKLKVSFSVAQDPELCGIKGASMALTHIEEYERALLT